MKPRKEDEGFVEKLFSAAHEGLFKIIAITDTVYALKRQADFDRVSASLMPPVQFIAQLRKD